MASFRRVVTGHRADGRSIIASDSTLSSTEIPGLGGIEVGTLWQSDTVFHYPDDGREPPPSSWFPPIGGVRFLVFVLPPGSDLEALSNSDDAQLAGADAVVPGLLDHFTSDTPGMHRSATCDMFYVVSGRCVLELDDGSATTLAAGDVIVQSGTMHRWNNPFAEPCQVVGAMVGAVQSDGGQGQ